MQCVGRQVFLSLALLPSISWVQAQAEPVVPASSAVATEENGRSTVLEVVPVETVGSGAVVRDALPVVVVSGQPVSAVSSVVDVTNQQQPQALADGADYLKNLAGFSAVRKGGVDADPLLRGMGGSRLAILLDGAPVMGGCSNRMDPPTAYVLPETFEQVRIIKGPQSVAYGSGVSAGAVLFERVGSVFDDFGSRAQPELEGRLQTTFGSFNRREQLVQTALRAEHWLIGAQANHAEAGNYRDGDGNTVASRYRKQAWQWRAAVSLGEHHALELKQGRSEGEAAYADRGVDGSRFDRDYWQLTWSARDLGEHWRSSEWQLSQSKVDHVMDNYKLRIDGWLPGNTLAAMNPARRNDKLRWHNELQFGAHQLVAGVDAERDRHIQRMSMDQRHLPYRAVPWTDSALFERQGIYAEWTQVLNEQQRLVAGGRVDRARARDQRIQVSSGGHHGAMTVNPSANQSRHETLHSGFVRYEHDFAWAGGQARSFIGWGQSQRLPDYWELISKEAVDSLSAFNTPKERYRQWDTGLEWQSERTRWQWSLFAADIDNYSLIEANYPKTMQMMGMSHTRYTTVTRPVRAVSYGSELMVEHALDAHWWTQASLAFVHASNLTDHQPLAQQPPAEMKWSLEYRASSWQVGALWRVSAAQHRVAVNQGGIAGVDTGTSPGFSTLGLYGRWQPQAALTISAGIDNLFDRYYREHLARPLENGTALSLQRIAEPGRSAYLRVEYRF